MHPDAADASTDTTAPDAPADASPEANGGDGASDAPAEAATDGAADGGNGGSDGAVADAFPDGPPDAPGDGGGDAGGPTCPPGAACDDGNACTVGDVCGDGGTCVGGPPKSCDDGDACTTDSCDPAAGCRHVDRSRCEEPNCSLGSCAGVDTDGDGFSDAVEDADYIDLNCNGVHDAGDFDFPHRAPYIFGAVAHDGTGPGMLMPTVTDPTAALASATVVVTVTTGGGFGPARFSYAVNGGTPSTPREVRPTTDIAGNVRLLFYASSVADFGLDAGDTYTFTTAMGPSVKIADKNLPNVYVQYDYMDYAAPGAACATDGDCDTNGAEPNDVCHAGACNHDHFPNDPLMRQVVDAYAAHGITLYIDPVHHAVPHANVITWSRPDDGTMGARAACAGADVVAGDITTGGAVNFHDIKNRTTFGGPFDPKRRQVFRYAVFGHLSSCLSEAAGTGYCGNCPTDRATPGGVPAAGATGTGEILGNDFIVSAADSLHNRAGSVPNDPFFEPAIFMHELGHNLGLHHLGDVGTPTFAPNYLSVMNYNYTFGGIRHAAAPGGTTSVESLRELNYSEHELTTLVEGALNESAGVSPLASGYTGIITFYDATSYYTHAPEAGPIDWSGNGSIDAAPVSVDLNLIGGAVETMPGYRDWDHPAVGGGACTVDTDCRVNRIRQVIHDLGGSGVPPDPQVDPHEPCVRGRCQSLGWAFQCFPWGMAD
jgi:hypothetical protein